MPIGPEFWVTFRNVCLSFVAGEACRHVIYSYMVLPIWTCELSRFWHQYSTSMEFKVLQKCTSYMQSNAVRRQNISLGSMQCFYCLDSSHSENNGIHKAYWYYPDVPSNGSVQVSTNKYWIASELIVKHYLISPSQFHICTSGVQSMHCVDVKRQWKWVPATVTIYFFLHPSWRSSRLIPAIFFSDPSDPCSAHSFCFLLYMYFSPSSGWISW